MPMIGSDRPRPIDGAKRINGVANRNTDVCVRSQTTNQHMAAQLNSIEYLPYQKHSVNISDNILQSFRQCAYNLDEAFGRSFAWHVLKTSFTTYSGRPEQYLHHIHP
jgi:hypothetical protein